MWLHGHTGVDGRVPLGELSMANLVGLLNNVT